MPDSELLPENILPGLKTTFIGQKILYYPRLDSTMEIARREALWGADAGTVIIAGEQTAGRGRLQRTWISPPGSLAISVILRPNLDKLSSMIMLAALAVTDTIHEVTGLKPVIKWPNDILLREKKISGILIENDIRNGQLKYTVLGIGININVRISQYPEIATIATSLADELGREISRRDVLVSLLEELERGYRALANDQAVWQRWKDNLVTLGQKVQVQIGRQIYTGTAEEVTRDGSLMLRQKEGGLVKIIAGDVSLQ